MAIDTSKETYCHLTFRENGKVVSRRIHRLEVQDRNGHLWVLSGKRLPDAITVNTGHGFAGEHLAEILLRPPSAVVPFPPERSPSEPWPTGRDMLNMVVAILGFNVCIAIADAIAQALG